MGNSVTSMSGKVDLPESLKDNISLFSEEEKKVLEILISLDQQHLFKNWPKLGIEDASKKAFVQQLVKLNNSYPGGHKSYIENAKHHLEASLHGENPYKGYKASIPHGERLSPLTKEWEAFEKKGLEEIGNTAFVLVAGGLGERLGYNGIKVALQSELTTERTFIENYIDHILALQQFVKQETNNDIEIPLMIMTSDDTMEKTVEILKENNYFGMKENQITILKQEKVPSLSDNDGHYVIDEKDPFSLVTKPHGHGDVHMLLHQSGLAKKWHKDGKKWIVFFQDTNLLVFFSLLPMIGVSLEHNFDVNSLTVPRKPGEAVGAIVNLLNESSGHNLTVNVEYNQLSSLLPEGDSADEKTGFSPFPGNTNVLVFGAENYYKVLEKSNGIIAEFINPKYKDDTKTSFKKPTRLECMMQDFPKLLGNDAKVGFTECERWACFSAAKNNLIDAAVKCKKTGAAESASSSEFDYYYYFRKIVGSVEGVNVNVEGNIKEFKGIPVKYGARIILYPSFGLNKNQIASHFDSDCKVEISEKSTLVLEGDVKIKNLHLDGTLIIRAKQGAKVEIDSLVVKNKGWEFVDIDIEKEEHEYLRVRGFKLVKFDQREELFNEPGNYKL